MANLNVVKRLAGGTSLGVALAISALASTGSAGIGATPAAAASNSTIYCQGYAQDAQRRYRDYVRKQCGNRINTVWNPDYGTHFGYCMRNSQATTDWLKDLRYRTIMNECGNGFPRASRNGRRG